MTKDELRDLEKVLRVINRTQLKKFDEVQGARKVVEGLYREELISKIVYDYLADFYLKRSQDSLNEGITVKGVTRQ